jgi:type VI secretion system secreted protein VgrG
MLRPVASAVAILTLCLVSASCSKSSGSGSGDPSGGGGGAGYTANDPFPHLHSAATFALLANTSITNWGTSTVYGNIGINPGTTSEGLPQLKMTGGNIHVADNAVVTAQNDAASALQNLKGSPCSQTLSGDLGGRTLSPGTYCFSDSASLNGLLTLDSQNNAAADFVFIIQTQLTVQNGAGVKMINGGSICNVYWDVGSTANVGAGASFVGSIFALGNIAIGSGSTLNGKAISRTGSITLDTASIYDNTCSE